MTVRYRGGGTILQRRCTTIGSLVALLVLIASVWPIETAQAQVGTCRVTNSYQLTSSMSSLSLGGGTHLHVEFYTPGNPEYETMLPAGETPTGTYSMQPYVLGGGYWWQYHDCSDAQIRANIDAHITRRQAAGANNGGYVDWHNTLFVPGQIPVSPPWYPTPTPWWFPTATPTPWWQNPTATPWPSPTPGCVDPRVYCGIN